MAETDKVVVRNTIIRNIKRNRPFIPVFIRFIRATYEFTEYLRCKMISGSYIWYDVVRCSYLDTTEKQKKTIFSNRL